MNKATLLKPTGLYQVGMSKLDLFDQYRPDLIHPQGRLIPIQITFPIEKEEQIPQPKIFEERSPTTFPPLEVMGYSHLSDLSQIAKSNCPLVIFNHGYDVAMTDYAMIIEELASHGYVVISIQHRLNVDPKLPSFCENRSTLEYSRTIDNILYVFEWTKNNRLLKDKINTNRTGLMGHSFGASALLMLAQRTSELFRPDNSTLLPHDHSHFKECIVCIDNGFAYPPNTKYPILFCLSEERQPYQEKLGTLENLKAIGHPFKYYKGTRHISFMDHGWALDTVPNYPNEKYFHGTEQERELFWHQLRNDILSFLDKNLAL